MQQKLDESMTILSYPKCSVESDWLYISENQFIWNGDLLFLVNAYENCKIPRVPPELYPGA